MFAGSMQTTQAVAERNKEALDTLRCQRRLRRHVQPGRRDVVASVHRSDAQRGREGSLLRRASPASSSSLLTEAASLDMKFDWVAADPNNYDPALLDGRAPRPTASTCATAFYPFLDPALGEGQPGDRSSTETLMAQYKPDGKIAYLGVQGLSAWLLFAKAAGECGADLTPRLRLGEDAGDHRLDRRRTAGRARPADREGERLHGDPRGQGPEVPTRRRLRAQRRHLQL